MFDELDGNQQTPDGEQLFDLFQELHQNTPDEIRRKRTHFRVTIKAGVTVQAGNTSQLADLKIQGVTGDISAGGLCALFPMPLNVGDIYRLQFDRDKIDLPLTFARCIRSRLVREDAFEIGFRFFSPIALPDNVVAEDASLSL